MENSIHWSSITMIIYILMGTIPTLLIKYATKIQYRKTIIKMDNKKYLFASNKTIYYFWGWLYITFFATFRKADGIFGGADSLSYIMDFMNSDKLVISFKKAITIQNYREPGYMFIVKFIHYFTDNPKVYFFIIYGFIAFTFLYFISVFASEIKNYAVLPLFIYPFILGFNTMRESLAVSFVLLSIIELNKKKKITTLIYLFIATMIHFTAGIFFSIPFMYWIANTRLIKNKSISKKRAIVVLFGYFAGAILSIEFLKSIVMTTHFYHYINEKQNISGLIRYSVLTILLIVFYKELVKQYNSHTILVWLSFFDLILWPITSSLNFWRADEYFAIARAIMWCDVSDILINKFISVRKHRICKIIIYFLAIIWFSYRIYRTYEGSSLMPYIFN